MPSASHGFRRYVLLLTLAISVAILGACSGDAAPTATATTTAATATPTPTPSTQATPSPEPDPLLRVMSPRDGAGVEISAVRVLGIARPDSVVAVNGIPVDVGADGTFRTDIAVTPGGNLIEVTAVAPSGESETEQVAVFGVEPAAALPLSIFYPKDGLTVVGDYIAVIGGTRPDAVVGINGGVPVINRYGIFEADLPLEVGANFIEVVAADLNDNVNFSTVVVFREQ